MRCVRLRGLPSTTDSTSGPIGSGCSQSFPIRRRTASRIQTVFRCRTRSRTGSGKEREAVRNKEKATSDTDIIRLRHRFCYTSLFFTLTEKSHQRFIFSHIYRKNRILTAFLVSYLISTCNNTIIICKGLSKLNHSI